MEEISDKYEENISMEDVTDTAIDFVQPDRIIQGEVVTIEDEFVYVNVGTKSDGRVSLEEFKEKPEIGDDIEVVLISRRMVDGMYVFSKKAAEDEKRWLGFMDGYKEGSPNILGVVKGAANRGIIVDCDGINAFLPFSHAANIRVDKTNNTTTPVWFKIKDIKKDRKTIILSRREYLEEENERKWNNFLSKYQIGDRIKGKVHKFIEFGAIIEVEELNGFLSKNDMSWRKVFKQKKILEAGEEKEFLILNIDKEVGKISLGLKQLNEDPWLSVEDKYHVDDIVSGRVVTLTNSGVYAELEEGIEGFVNSYNISWTKRSVNPREVFQKGKNINVKILDINMEERRISMGFKQLLPNPWDTIDERFGIDTIHQGKIKKIVSFGMFVELEDGIDGLIHVSDVNWDENIKNPLKTFNIGDEVEFKILEIKKDEMKVACGIKQLTKSPWEIIKEQYLPRSIVSGVISGIVSFGLFVRINNDVEGLVHISEVSQNRIENLEEQFKIGDKIDAIILGIDVERKRLSLSIKQYKIMTEKDEVSKILSDTSPRKVTIGDIIKIKIDE